MNAKTYSKKQNDIRSLPLEQQREAFLKLDFEYFESVARKTLRTPFKAIFWEIIHNIHDLIVFLILLPFLPIAYIINIIKGEK